MAFVHAQRLASQSRCISQSIFFSSPAATAPGERGRKRKGGGESEVNRGTHSEGGEEGVKNWHFSLNPLLQKPSSQPHFITVGRDR